MSENSKISAKVKRVLLFSIFIIPTLLCFAFYIFMIRKPFLENPAGLYKQLNYFGSKQFNTQTKDTVYTTIPDFSFISQEGKSFTSKDLEGKMYVAALICTECSTSCPKIAAQFFRMQKKVNYIKAFTVVAFTINPDTDTPDALKGYARTVHADPKYWNFLTGNKKDLLNLAKNGFEINFTDSTLSHQSSIYLIDKKLHIRGIYDGTSTEQVNRLIDEIKVLDAEYRVSKRLKN
jgi:protein SCO1/2